MLSYSIDIVLAEPARLIKVGLARDFKLPLKEKYTMLTGLYVHQHWPYRYPYNARTWSVEDYQGFLGGLQAIGYNMVMIWPMLETIPRNPMPSDWRMLRRLERVIDYAQRELGFSVWLTLAANVVPIEEMAVRATFENRHFFHSDRRFDPRDESQLRSAMARWRQLLEPLKHVNAISTIDSDPGSYPGSTNAEFVNILNNLGNLYRELNPEIELVYWAEHGWPTYARFLEKGFFEFETQGTPYDRRAEFKEAFELFAQLNREPWGIAIGRGEFESKIEIARDLGILDRCIAFYYGGIEGEPSYPMTNWWPQQAAEAGRTRLPRGGMGNAQSHVVQLPNIFAFACGARGKYPTRQDYLEFAERLVPGQAEVITDAWELFGSKATDAFAPLLERLEALEPAKLRCGNLRGLIFGDPVRYVSDLGMMLRVRQAWLRFVAAVDSGKPADGLLAAFVQHAEVWYLRTGYKDSWWWEEMPPTFEKYGAPSIRQVFADFPGWGNFRSPWAAETNQPVDETFMRLYREEVATPRLLEAMKVALLERRGIH